MKNSGIEWIGEIPEFWQVKKLKRDTNVMRGASPRPIDDPIYFDDNGEFSWVRISDVTSSNGILKKTEQKLSKLGSSLSVKLMPGELFLSIAGSVGKQCITDIPCCIHDGFVYFPKLKLTKKFLYYIFEAGECYKGLGKLGTQLNLNTETVGDIEIPFPSQIEQKQISDYLDSQTRLIDSQIGSNQKLVTLLQEKRQSTINHAVTKGLDPNAPMKDSGIEWIGEIPEQWNIFKLKHLGKSITGLTYQPEDVAENQTKGILVLRASNIQNRSLSLEDTVYVDVPLNDELLTKEGDILICSRSGSRDLIGKNLTISKDLSGCTFGAFMTVFRSCFSEFISKVMNSSIFTNQSGLFNTSTINQLTLGVLNNFVIPFPIDINEQKQISDFLDKQTTKIDSLISKTQTQITKLKEFRQSLISAAVTGKIDVSN